MTQTITNDYEALVVALRLAITAPTDDRSLKCITMANVLMARLSTEDVERAKAEALETLDMEDE